MSRGRPSNIALGTIDETTRARLGNVRGTAPMAIPPAIYISAQREQVEQEAQGNPQATSLTLQSSIETTRQLAAREDEIRDLITDNGAARVAAGGTLEFLNAQAIQEMLGPDLTQFECQLIWDLTAEYNAHVQRSFEEATGRIFAEALDEQSNADAQQELLQHENDRHLAELLQMEESEAADRRLAEALEGELQQLALIEELERQESEAADRRFAETLDQEFRAEAQQQEQQQRQLEAERAAEQQRREQQQRQREEAQEQQRVRLQQQEQQRRQEQEQKWRQERLQNPQQTTTISTHTPASRVRAQPQPQRRQIHQLHQSTITQLGLLPNTNYYITANGRRLEAHCDGSSANVGMRAQSDSDLDQVFMFEDGEVPGTVRIRTGRGAYVEANCSGSSAGCRSKRLNDPDQLFSIQRVSEGVYRITCRGSALEGNCKGDFGGGRIVGTRRIREHQDQYFTVQQAQNMPRSAQSSSSCVIL
eukprot:c11056_g1_i1.p1 GENE.c11056_g1_i1~~c11056_g1_i1.p1  ORF type:complete len:490 (+),score=81.05 c11056_g1_i1:38-1471(+)